jgi:hypothetical protein
MYTDYAILFAAWIVTIVLLVIFIPKNKLRLAQVAFLFKQLITWLTGLAVVEAGLIEYPIRLFPIANRTSFTFEYFIYPSICAIFNVHYPQEKSRFAQFMYYIYYCTAITIVEVIVERYTNIITYVHWTWYITWITLFITFYLTRNYCLWFFKQKE